MSKKKLKRASQLIKQREFDEARRILETVDHPVARQWLTKLDQIAPAKPRRRRSALLMGVVAIGAAVLVILVLQFGQSPSSEPLPTAVAENPTETATSPPAPPLPDAGDGPSCPALIQSSYDTTQDVCASIGDGEACYGNITVDAAPETLEFTQTGDIVNVEQIESLRLSSMDTTRREWGISLLRLSVLPDEAGAEGPPVRADLILFGNVEVAGAIDADGTPAALQAFTFRSGVDDRPCAEAPDSGILMQTPAGVGRVSFVVNEVVIEVGSTVYLQAEPGAEMVVNVVEGQADLTAFGVTVNTPAGTRSRVPLDGTGVASGPPVGPEAYDETGLQTLPLLLLPNSVAIAPALLDPVVSNDPPEIPAPEVTTRAQLATVLAGEGSTISLSQDGTRAFTLAEFGSNVVQIWDTQTGELFLDIDAGERISRAAWNPDGSRILLLTDFQAMTLYDAQTGTEIWSVPQPRGFIGAGWNADGTRILAELNPDVIGETHVAALYDAQTGDELQLLEVMSNAANFVWSQDGSRLFYWSLEGNTANGIATTWDPVSGSAISSVPISHAQRVFDVEWNADGSRMLSWDTLTNGGGSVHVWDLATGEELLTMAHSSWIDGALWNPDETQILSWSQDGTARTWDAGMGEELLVLDHGFGVEGATWNSDGSHILTWTGLEWRADDTIIVWDAQSGAELIHLVASDPVEATGLASPPYSSSAVWNADETQILTWSSYDGTIRAWDAE